MGRLFRNLFAGAFCVIVLTLSTGVTALAAETMQNPTIGHNGAPAVGCGSGSATVTPGNSANSTAAVSQYDVACLRLTSH